MVVFRYYLTPLFSSFPLPCPMPSVPCPCPLSSAPCSLPSVPCACACDYLHYHTTTTFFGKIQQSDCGQRKTCLAEKHRSMVVSRCMPQSPSPSFFSFCRFIFLLFSFIFLRFLPSFLSFFSMMCFIVVISSLRIYLQ